MGTLFRVTIWVFFLAALSACAQTGSIPNANDPREIERMATDPSDGEASPEAREIQQSELSQFGSEPSRVPKQIPDDLKHLDPNKVIPADAFSRTMDFYITYRSKFKNQKFLAVIDFRIKNSKPRFFLVNLVSGAVETYLVAHGKNSDPSFTGYARSFSNRDGSLMSSLGAYMGAEPYEGQHGLSIRLDGLEATNSNARARAIVMHGADYVTNGRDPIGRSFGCPAVDFQYRDRLVQALKSGSLIYAFYQ